MAWRVWGDQFLTADLTGTSQYLRFKPTANISLRAIRTWFVFYNDPSYTNLTMHLYSDRDSLPGSKIADSITFHNKADLYTENNAHVETHFEFSDISLRQDTYYHFVASATGYTYSDSSLIAWTKAFPDPVHPNPKNPDFVDLAIQPYFLTIVGDEL